MVMALFKDDFLWKVYPYSPRSAKHPDLPFGYRWRGSVWFTTVTIAIAVFTDIYIYGMIVPVMPYALLERANVEASRVLTMNSIMIASFSVAVIISSPLVGYCSDRWKSRNYPLLSGLLGLLGSTLLLMFGNTVLVWLLARILQGIAAAVVWTVGLALLAETVGHDNLGKSMGVIGSALTMAMSVSPAVSGAVFEHVGYAETYSIGTGLIFFDLILRLLLVEKRVHLRPIGDAAAENEHTLPESSPSADSSLQTHNSDKTEEHNRAAPPNKKKKLKLPVMLQLLCHTRVIHGLWLAFVQGFLLGSLDTVLVIHVKDVFNMHADIAGLAFVALALPVMVASPIGGWAMDRYGAKLISTIGLFFLLPWVIALQVPNGNEDKRTQNMGMLFFFLAMIGSGLSIVVAPVMSELASVVYTKKAKNPNVFGKRSAFGQAYGIFNIAFSAGTTLGPLISAALMNSAGWSVLCDILGVVIAITIPLNILFCGSNLLDKRRKGHKDTGTECTNESIAV